MINFKQYLSEKAKKIPYISNPKIGWWLEKEIITFYHGTHSRNLDWILKNGLIAPTEGYTAGKVSLALEPNTSLGYAAMSGQGGESSFRDAGVKASTTLVSDRVVLILRIPKKIVLKKMIDKRGLMKQYKGKLEDKGLYDSFKGPDFKYYEMAEIRLPGKVDKKYIKGYMFKK